MAPSEQRVVEEERDDKSKSASGRYARKRKLRAGRSNEVSKTAFPPSASG